MRRGCATSLSFVGAAILSWPALAIYFMSREPRLPSDNGGYAMGVGMFMITGGLLIAAIVGALAALLVWIRSKPREP